MLRIITGDENDPSNREIRVRHFRQPARRVPLSSPYPTAPLPKPINVFPHRRGRYPRAAIGIIALTAPPSASAGTSATRRKSLRGLRRQLRRRRPTPLRRRRAPASNPRSPTRAPNCRCRNRASSGNPVSSPASGYRRRSQPRPARRMISAPTRAMPAPRDPSSLRAGLSWRASARRPVPNLPQTVPQQTRRQPSAAESDNSQGRAASRRSPAPARRGEHIVDRKSLRLGPDAADRHPWRAGAGGPAGKRDFQVRRPAATDQHSRRAARELGCGQDRSSIATG